MKTLLISDVTLRSLNAKDYSSLSFRERLETVKSLSELKVDYVELPSCCGDKAGEVLSKTVSACVKGSGIAIESGFSLDDVQNNFALISCAKKKRLIVSIPVSPTQMEYRLSKKPKVVLELLESLTKKSLELCGDVEVSLEDATRAEFSFLKSAIISAIKSGAKTITLVDSVGCIVPTDFYELIKKLYAEIPELVSVTLGISCSDEFSLAVANILSAINSGASLIKLSACGNSTLPRFEKTISAIDNICGKLGFNLQINKTVISMIIDRISSFFTNGEKTSIFDNHSKDKIEKLPNNISLQTLTKIIKARGYDLSNDDIKTVQEEIKRLSEKKEVTTKELDVVIATSVMQVPPTYSLVKFAVVSSNVISTTASITLKKNDKEISGLSFGNGSVDSAFLALENIMGRHFELDNFELGSVTEGKEAMGQAIVSLRNDGKIYSGKGLSTDIVGASIRAYINAVNKILYEEENR